MRLTKPLCRLIIRIAPARPLDGTNDPNLEPKPLLCGSREIGRTPLTNLFPRRKRARKQEPAARVSEPTDSLDPEIHDTQESETLEDDRLVIDKAVLDNRFASIVALSQFAKGETSTIQPEAVSGKLALVLASPDSSDIKGKLFKWTLYYSDELKDLQVYHQGVHRDLITDPSAVEAVTHLAEGLLEEAEAMAIPQIESGA